MDRELLDRLNGRVDGVLQVLQELRNRIAELERELSESHAQREQAEMRLLEVQDQLEKEHAELEGMASKISGALESPSQA